MSQILRIWSSIGLPSLAISVGFVVTPSTMPHAAPFFNSSRFAVSRKNFMELAFRKHQYSLEVRLRPDRYAFAAGVAMFSSCRMWFKSCPPIVSTIVRNVMAPRSGWLKGFDQSVSGTFSINVRFQDRRVSNNPSASLAWNGAERVDHFSWSKG